MAAKRHDARLILIRHAPIAVQGILCGRTDAPATVDPAIVAQVQAVLPPVAQLVTSPALRCRQTTEALFPALQAEQDARLWEQDFGAHDGRPYNELPDLGILSNEELAHYAAPGGESFNDMCNRTWPALRDWSQRAHEAGAPIAVVAHAGVIRGAIGLAMGHGPAGLGFEVDNLSVTQLRVGADGPFSVISTNGLPT